jgi:hypothetical protein
MTVTSQRQFCLECTKRLIAGWKGWPSPRSGARWPKSGPVPALPVTVEGTCPECGCKEALAPSNILYQNIHGPYNTGLPDYFILVVSSPNDANHEFLKKFGQPYDSSGRPAGRNTDLTNYG